MPLIADYALDALLAKFDTEANRFDLCETQEPTTYTEATSTYTVGNEAAAVSVGSPGDGGGGRQVTVAAITAGSVTKTATAAYWALTDVGNTRLLAAGALNAPQAVTNGNTFATTAFTISVPDAV